MGDKSIRAFIAIELPLPLREDLIDSVTHATPNVPDRAIRWVKPGNIHLTLRFLGNTQETHISAIGEKLQAGLNSWNPFTLTTDKLGCFPNPGRPRVVWVGLTGDLEQLVSLNRLVEQTVTDFGWEPEKRRFNPHLTVGRVKNSRQVAAANIPYGNVLIDQTFRVDSISLIESTLMSSGAIYTPRYHCTLGKP